MQIVFFIVGVFLQWTLEVLGAGGAIWGMSEVWHMRGGTNDDPVGSNDTFRIPANIVFVLGFIRMFFRYSSPSGLKTAIVDPQDWVKARGSKNASEGALMCLELLGFCLGFFLQWVLEVLGAGGACWGMSEVWNLRNDPPNPAETNDDFRWVANTVFTVAIFRMAQKYCPDHSVHTAMLSPQNWLRSLQVNMNQGGDASANVGTQMTEMNGKGQEDVGL